MKAIRYPDGRVEFIGTPEELSTLLPKTATALPPDPVRRVTQEREVFEVLCSDTSKAFTIDEILSRLGGSRYRPSYSMALSKLARDGVIAHPKRGLYQYKATNLNLPPRPGVNGSRVSRSHPR